MGCSRCGHNNGQQSMPRGNQPSRPGTVIPNPMPSVSRPSTAVNPSDIVKNAINGLKYVPNR